MPGDLEDFLRRAAQRRQQKAAQEKQQAPQRREKPQYSDSRSERIVRPQHLDEAILTAEIVDDQSISFGQRLKKVEDAKRAAAKAKQIADDLMKQAARKTPAALATEPTGVPIHDLLKLLRRPGGIQQAILLREILDRPEHRW